ncbi:MAG: transposase [Kiritimatiellaeota bacterium]|nr:transposase [Kiritimatiellota bacterium]
MACESSVASTQASRGRTREHLLAQLVCPGRHTLTSLITTRGRQFEDWSADYSLYARQRIHPQTLFREVRNQIEHINAPDQPLVLALDDTILRKTGKCIPNTAYRKDPLGPAFHLNLVWAQRMIQLSAAVPAANGDVRMIPVAFQDASTPRKPRKTAPPEQWEAYRERMKQTNLNRRALDAIRAIQQERTATGQTAPLHLLVDGSYTNRKMLRNLPTDTTLIGRIRKDANLNHLPQGQCRLGRKRFYGLQAPSPEQVRIDPNRPWQIIQANVAGKIRDIKVKTLSPLRWRAAGNLDLLLVVIAPAPYLKSLGSRRLYRQPVYLICTDPSLPLERLVQEYIWRWDIEVNHRDEKTLLGVGQAQIRNPNSVTSVPATAVAAYAMLHVAAIKAYGWNGKPGVIPPPKWHDPEKKRRASTMDLINELRRELWSSAIRSSPLTDFMSQTPTHTNPLKNNPHLDTALFYCTA